MTSPIIQGVMNIYSSFDAKLIQSLDTIYRSDIEFVDPFHHIDGLAQLTDYFSGMLEGLSECRFEFQQVVENTQMTEQGAGDQAVLFWVMHYRHPKLAQGKMLQVSGSSHLKFESKIFYHRDYFDAGAMIYEHVPLLGFGIRQIKKRLER